MVVNSLDRSAFLKLLPSVRAAGFYGALGLCWMLNVLPSQSKCRSTGKGEGPSPLHLLSTPRFQHRAGAILLAIYLGLGASIKIQ
jgi:hypothetical protein